MCIVIDANVISDVFRDHDPDFGFVRKWIIDGPGCMVIGGTRYKQELARIGTVLKLVSELSRQHKVFLVDDESVDELEDLLRMIVPKRCDDPHIIALVGVSRCPVVCTKDERANEFLKTREYYPWHGFAPKIYKRANQKNQLLTNEVASCHLLRDLSCNPNYPRFKERLLKEKRNSNRAAIASG